MGCHAGYQLRRGKIHPPGCQRWQNGFRSCLHYARPSLRLGSRGSFGKRPAWQKHTQVDVFDVDESKSSLGNDGMKHLKRVQETISTLIHEKQALLLQDLGHERVEDALGPVES